MLLNILRNLEVSVPIFFTKEHSIRHTKIPNVFLPKKLLQIFICERLSHNKIYNLEAKWPR